MIDTYRLIGPVLRRLNVEKAHRLALLALKCGAARAFFPPIEDPACLSACVWDRTFSNPLGLAAGFDKNAEIFDEALSLGFGFVEVGGVTPKPQPGNPSPRVFRLDIDRAIINRMGFNNDGMEEVASRLRMRDPSKKYVGVNLGKNKSSDNAVSDYSVLARGFAASTDFLVINVSSPNTPGLRALQDVDPLIKIVRAVRSARDETISENRPPVLLKISPDLSASDVEDIAKVALGEGLEGLVVSNTTLVRPDSLQSANRNEAGGLSGAPLFEPSTQLLRRVYNLTKGKIPLVGVGGVSSGADAYAKIRSGASLIQLYTALVFEGPAIVNRIKRDLANLLVRDGFASVSDAVGVDCPET